MAYFPCFAVVGEDELGPGVGRVERAGSVEFRFSTCSITILNIQIILSVYFPKRESAIPIWCSSNLELGGRRSFFRIRLKYSMFSASCTRRKAWYVRIAEAVAAACRMMPRMVLLERERGREGERERGRVSIVCCREKHTHIAPYTTTRQYAASHQPSFSISPLPPLHPFSSPHQLTLGMCIVTVRPALFTFVDMVGARE